MIDNKIKKIIDILQITLIQTQNQFFWHLDKSIDINRKSIGKNWKYKDRFFSTYKEKKHNIPISLPHTIFWLKNYSLFCPDVSILAVFHLDLTPERVIFLKGTTIKFWIRVNWQKRKITTSAQKYVVLNNNIFYLFENFQKRH